MLEEAGAAVVETAQDIKKVHRMYLNFSRHRGAVNFYNSKQKTRERSTNGNLKHTIPSHSRPLVAALSDFYRYTGILAVAKLR